MVKPLDLTKVGQIVRDLTMQDAVQILRDPQGTSDDTWDPTTGTYTRPVNDDATIYSGQASVWQKDLQTMVDKAGQEYEETTYWCGLPYDSTAVVLPKDIVVVTASAHDPAMVGKRFVVDVMIFGTNRAMRMIKMFQDQPRVV